MKGSLYSYVISAKAEKTPDTLRNSLYPGSNQMRFYNSNVMFLLLVLLWGCHPQYPNPPESPRTTGTVTVPENPTPRLVTTPTKSLFQLVPPNEEQICSAEIKKVWLSPRLAKKVFIPTILRQSCFKFDPKQFSSVLKENAIILPLFSNTSVEFSPIPRKLRPGTDRKLRTGPEGQPSDFSWAGQIRATGEKKPGIATLVVNEARRTMVGIIRYGRTLVQIEPLANGLHAILEIKPTGFPDEADPTEPPENVDTREHLNQLAPSPDHSGENASLLPNETACSTDETAPYIIDILAFYTRSVMEIAGGSPEAVQSRLIAIVNDANRIYMDNDIPIHLNLLQPPELAPDSDPQGRNPEQGGDLQEDLNVLTGVGGQTELSKTATSLRVERKADLVTLFVEAGNICGKGIVNTWNNPNPDIAFSVVVESCSIAKLSFLHELGHNMGARHELSSTATRRGYAHGHRSNPAQQYTIMATRGDCEDCERMPFWSSPNHTYDDRSERRGDDWANNTEVLKTVACQISRFR